jgi:hypothetical protein
VRQAIVARLLFAVRVRLQHEFTNLFLRIRVGDGPQREVATLTVDGVLARRERDVPATAAAALPHGETDQLLAFEDAVGRVQLGLGEFAGRADLHVDEIVTRLLPSLQNGEAYAASVSQ